MQRGKKLPDSKCYRATRLCKMFSDKYGTLIGLKTLIKKINKTGIIKRLPGSGHPQQTNMHFNHT